MLIQIAEQTGHIVTLTTGAIFWVLHLVFGKLRMENVTLKKEMIAITALSSIDFCSHVEKLLSFESERVNHIDYRYHA